MIRARNPLQANFRGANLRRHSGFVFPEAFFRERSAASTGGEIGHLIKSIRNTFYGCDQGQRRRSTGHPRHICFIFGRNAALPVGRSRCV